MESNVRSYELSIKLFRKHNGISSALDREKKLTSLCVKRIPQKFILQQH